MANRFWPLSLPYGFAVANESVLAGRTAACADGSGAGCAGWSAGQAAAARATASLEVSLPAAAAGRMRSVFTASGLAAGGCDASTSRTFARTVRVWLESDPDDGDFTAAG